MEEVPLQHDSSGLALPFKVPRTPLTIRTTGLSADELSAVTVALVLLTQDPPGPDELTGAIAGLLLIVRRFRRLKAANGEVSVVDAIVRTRPRSTVDAVTLFLYGKACRNPNAACRFLAEDGTTCGITRDQAQGTVDFLISEAVLKPTGGVPPIEYAVVR
ncbi:hypothetical protein CryarDRAFT_1133 [Cryptosporangium arvum DSM 44712]|uniref:Uncharacterized protein n=1 Tax=Cryptosporangium arvum DSM 44712 TaxID=927661 RepID=A0A010ZN03_9ACTN|nr:hypothetical protein CryarDRAFT_1133 [Cryptosporangium arvum DSM 44712]